MTSTKKLIALLTFLMLLLSIVACTAQEDNTPPTTDPQQTTAPASPETEEPRPEETTAPTETEPEETEPQLQFRDREPDGVPLTTAQLQEVFTAITESDPEHWYETIFVQNFTDPREMNFFLLFGDGIPAERGSAELTEAEKEFFIQNGNEFVIQLDVDRIPRETVESVLCTYFDLTAEDLEQLDMENWTDVPYFPETDCFYGTNNSYNGDTPDFQEGYRMEDGTLVIYFRRYSTMTVPGKLHRAEIWMNEDLTTYRVLQIIEVEP